MEVLQNPQKFRVLYGSLSLTKLTEIGVNECCTRARTRAPAFYKASGTGYIPRCLPYFPGIIVVLANRTYQVVV